MFKNVRNNKVYGTLAMSTLIANLTEYKVVYSK